MKPGSSSTAVLKCSTASGYCALLNACIPLLMWSRARSLLQPMFAAARAHAARTRTHLRMLLPCLHLGGHQTYLIDARAMRDIDGFGHPLIFEVGIALHEDHALGARLEDLFEARTHFV